MSFLTQSLAKKKHLIQPIQDIVDGITLLPQKLALKKISILLTIRIPKLCPDFQLWSMNQVISGFLFASGFRDSEGLSGFPFLKLEPGQIRVYIQVRIPKLCPDFKL